MLGEDRRWAVSLGDCVGEHLPAILSLSRLKIFMVAASMRDSRVNEDDKR